MVEMCFPNHSSVKLALETLDLPVRLSPGPPSFDLTICNQALDIDSKLRPTTYTDALTTTGLVTLFIKGIIQKTVMSTATHDYISTCSLRS